MKWLSFLAVGPQKKKRPLVTSGAASYIFGEIGYTFMLDKPSALFGREQWSSPPPPIRMPKPGRECPVQKQLYPKEYYIVIIVKGGFFFKQKKFPPVLGYQKFCVFSPKRLTKISRLYT